MSQIACGVRHQKFDPMCWRCERDSRCDAEQRVAELGRERDEAKSVLEAARRLRNSALDPMSSKGEILEAVKDVTIAIGECDGTPPFAYDAARAAGEKK